MLWASYGQLIQAHNGYLEVYLNFGFVGCGLRIGKHVERTEKA